LFGKKKRKHPNEDKGQGGGFTGQKTMNQGGGKKGNEKKRVWCVGGCASAGQGGVLKGERAEGET